MAIAYYNPSAADDTGDGSVGSPKKLLASASTIAGTGGEVRCFGLQIVPLGNATWTNGSTRVVFAGVDLSATLIAGTAIRLTPPTLATAEVPLFGVASSVFSGGNTTVTLSTAYMGTTVTAATEQIPFHTALGATETFSAASQKWTGGWSAAGTQPADYVTALKGTGFELFTVTQDNTTIESNGRLFGWSTNAYVLSTTKTLRIVGVLNCMGNIGGILIATAAIRLWADTILGTCTGKAPVYCNNGANSWNTFFVDRVINHVARAGISGYFALWYINELIEKGSAANSHPGMSVIGRRELPATGDLTIHGNLGCRIGTLVVGAGAITYTGNVRVGGPLAVWRDQTIYGVTDMVTGRGGSGNGKRLNPSSTIFPLEHVHATLADASKAVTVKFYCYYAGTADDVPPCEVILLEPNGLTVAAQAFTPPNGDGWDHATEQSIAFSGTTLQKGSLQFAIRVRDNAAGDALLYVDDFSFTNAGDVAATCDLETLGLDVPLLNVTAGGGAGLLLAEAGVQ